MSPRCSVPQLNEVTLAVVAKQLIDALNATAADEDMSLPFAMITSYYDSMGVTTDIYQDLLNLILNSDYLDPAVRYFAMRLLIRDNVQSVATGVFPCPYYQKILELLIEQGHSITALNLKGVWVKDEHLPLMYDLIKNLKNLTVLNIPYISNDEILKYIGENCSNLKLLDVSGDTDITEIGICAMLDSNPSLVQSLTVVNIGNYGEENVCHTDVALLIARLPNLINLGSYSFVGKALLHIKESGKYPNFRSKLQYIHDIRPSNRIMKAIIELCPDLETVYLEEPDPGLIIQIKELKRVSRIKMNKFQCHELHQLLDKIGTQIKSLMLLQASGSFNFTHIADRCRNLEMIELYQLDIVTHEEEIPFMKLEHIEVLHTKLTASCLKYLLTASPELKKIIIGEEIKMTDDDITRMLHRTKLDKLEAVWFPNAPRLTSQSVETMMECCPKLQSLGQLSGWSFTPEDMLLMRAIIASTNTDLVLSPQESEAAEQERC